MSAPSRQKGNFTLPGESGYEELTLRLAERWGADVIRDCDGTTLSDAIVSTGLDIYSTLCLVRADNEWAKAHRDKLQQNYLMSFPVVAEGGPVRIDLLNGYFREQFVVNTRDDPKEWWQVFDRTTGREIPAGLWDFEPRTGTVTVRESAAWHGYTVNFLAYTVWEAISMYNHVTNNWGDRERLMPVDPIYPETRAFILAYLEKWLKDHPKTKVVRFTSMFYNFAWFWGGSRELRYVYSDWGGYDHTVSPHALREFEKAKGYRPCSEDFVNNGAYCSSHNVPSKKYREWMDFMNAFVVSFGAECIRLVHKAGKQAYMFYDDHWIGTEPYGERFKDFGFDGLIKCVFNGFEVRLCSGARGVKTRELRLHPYLFPTGLKGEPTFMKGGDPAADCRRFWTDIRRALLRAPIDRIGLGGYLHLTEDHPDFIGSIEEIAAEFRTIRGIIHESLPGTAPFKVAVLSAWGKLRSWICAGHMIRTLELNQLMESLAGLPFEVEFIDFDDIVERGIPEGVKVIVNAGRAGSAWSGGGHWTDARVIERISEWVGGGGGFIGVGEPSAALHLGRFFQLSHLLGVEREIGSTLSNDKPLFSKDDRHFIMEDSGGEIRFVQDVENIYVTDSGTRVLAEKGGSPRIAARGFGKGRSLYLSGFAYTPQNTRMLHRALYWAAGAESLFGPWTCGAIDAECAYYPGTGKLIVVNNGEKTCRTSVLDSNRKSIEVSLKPREMRVLEQ